MDKLSVLAVFKFELAVFVCLKTGGYLSKAIPSTFLSTFFFKRIQVQQTNCSFRKSERFVQRTSYELFGSLGACLKKYTFQIAQPIFSINSTVFTCILFSLGRSGQFKPKQTVLTLAQNLYESFFLQFIFAEWKLSEIFDVAMTYITWPHQTVALSPASVTFS